MADWCGTAISNWFRVRDVDAFTEAMDECHPDLVVTVRDKTLGEAALGVSGDSSDGGWPSFSLDDEEEEIDLPKAIVPHLAEGSIAVLMESGAKRNRYVSGSAVAINGDGRAVRVSLHDIYSLAETAFGQSVTKIEG